MDKSICAALVPIPMTRSAAVSNNCPIADLTVTVVVPVPSSATSNVPDAPLLAWDTTTSAACRAVRVVSRVNVHIMYPLSWVTITSAASVALKAVPRV